MAEKKVRKYRVKSNAAPHGHDDGKVYYPGDIIKTDMDLMGMFPNKFVPVGSSEDLEEQENNAQAATAAAPKTKGQKLMAGKAKARLDDEDKAEKEAGDEDEDENEKDEEESEEGDEDEETESESDEEDAERGEEEHTSKHGKDVTDKYPDAVKADLKVFQKGKKFTVVEGDDKAEKPLNKTPLKAAKVGKFIKDRK